MLLVITPAATAAANLAYMHAHETIWGLSQLAALALPVLLLFTGWGAKLAGLCARLARGNRSIALILFAALYLILAALTTAPFEYWRDAPSAVAPWLVGEAAPLLARIVAAALFLWIPFTLMRRSPRWWWLMSAVALVPVAFLILVALPIVVDPLTAHYEALKDRALAARIEALAARCGVPGIPVFVGGDDDTVVGLGPTKRIFLESGITTVETPSEIAFTVSHELKHYVMGDDWKALAVVTALLFVGLFLVQLLGRRAIARWHGRFGFADLSDPAALTLIVLILSAFWLCILPAFNWEARRIEFEADRFGLELSHQNAAAVQLFTGWTKTEPPDFDLFFKLFRQTHPSLNERIGFAQTYRPWETGQKLVYGDICAKAP